MAGAKRKIQIQTILRLPLFTEDVYEQISRKISRIF